jgi:hypothetical protein
MVVFGALTITTKKLQFQQKAMGIAHSVHPFKKPWYVPVFLHVDSS